MSVRPCCFRDSFHRVKLSQQMPQPHCRTTAFPAWGWHRQFLTVPIKVAQKTCKANKYSVSLKNCLSSFQPRNFDSVRQTARPQLPLIFLGYEIVCSLSSVIMRRHQIPEDLTSRGGTCLLPASILVLPVRLPPNMSPLFQQHLT